MKLQINGAKSMKMGVGGGVKWVNQMGAKEMAKTEKAGATSTICQGGGV